jgi:hypothetical protein
VGLIDGKEGQGLGPWQGAELLQQIAPQQPLGRHVEQIKRASLQLLPHRARLGGLQGRVQGRCPHPQLQQGLHLVLHQGDQRRNHHRQPRSAQAGT